MSEFKEIPEIPFWKTITNLRQLIRNPIPRFVESFEAHGDIFGSKMINGQRIILTRNPDHIRQVLQRDHRSFIKSEVQTEILAERLGKGLLTAEGDYWLKQRRLIQPGFHRKRLAGLARIMCDETNLVLDGAPTGQVNIHQFTHALTLRIVMRALFSTGMTQEDIDFCGRVIHDAQQLFVTQVRQPYAKPFMKAFGVFRYADKRQEELDKIVYRIINDRREKGGSHDDLLDMLLESRYEDTGEGMNDKQLRDEILILFVAGHDTTALSVGWTLFLLAQHPEVLTAVQTELEVLGDRDVTLDDLPNLDLTDRVIKESMRLYPPAWMVDRVATQDVDLGGHSIKEGDNVLASIYAVHRHPDYWQNPDSFDPDRWLPNAPKRPAFAYLPFGGGPRLCIGNHFATMEMHIALAQFLRRFTVKPITTDIELKPLITLHSRNPVLLNIEAR